ncbi:MAG: hypothetical protein LBR33_10630 [Propionibacteriaceae bacterium]|jgi:hypothetical protein|nr:hypothetical protein [Propionibacteriaceae bacterium]
MAITLRDVRLPDDAEAIVRFYDRYGFGFAHAMGFPLSPEAFTTMLRENDALNFVVMEDDGRLIGVSGIFRLDSAMASRPGETRGNHMLIESTARGGMQFGRMIETQFNWQLDNHVRFLTMRLRPQNKIAIFTYLRAGYRTTEVRPSVEGFVDFSSAFPHMIDAAAQVTADPSLGVQLPHFNWVHLKGDKGISGKNFDDGVTRHPDGHNTVSFHVEPKGMTSDFTLDMDTGKLWFVSRNGTEYTDLFLSVMRYSPDPDPAVVTLPARPVGAGALTVDTWGGLTLTHPRHLGPLYQDVFPDDEGHIVCYRRPPARTVTTEATDDGWVTIDAGGTVRTVRVDGDTIEVEVKLRDGAPDEPGLLAARPWIGLRTCEYAVAYPDEPRRDAYLHTGLWPPFLPGYEACADQDFSGPLAGAVQTWTDRAAGLAVTVEWLDAGRLRCEGQARADGPVLRYRVTVTDTAGPAAGVTPAPLEGTDVPEWSVNVSSQGQRLLRTPDRTGQVTVAAASGLIGWQAKGQTILVEATSSKGFHCLTKVPATIWPSLNAPREDVRRGPEWAEDDPRCRFADPTAAHGSDPDPEHMVWSVTGNADLTELELSSVAPAQYAGLDAVFNLKVPVSVETVELADSAGEWRTFAKQDDVDRPIGLWWAYTRKLRVPLGGGHVVIEPVSGHAAEILVRGFVEGFVINLMSRVTEDALAGAWRLRYEA